MSLMRSPFELSSRELARFEHVYTLQDADAVTEFIRARPLLASALVGAVDPLQDAFGRDTMVILAVERDPEDDLAPPMLFGWIQTGLPAEESLPRMRLFLEWWARSPLAIREHLVFGTDSQRPAA